jgi:hypothetical protein
MNTTTIDLGTATPTELEPFHAFAEVLSGDPDAGVSWLRTTASGDQRSSRGSSSSTRRGSDTTSTTTSASTSSREMSRSPSTVNPSSGCVQATSPRSRLGHAPRRCTRHCASSSSSRADMAAADRMRGVEPLVGIQCVPTFC